MYILNPFAFKDNDNVIKCNNIYEANLAIDALYNEGYVWNGNSKEEPRDIVTIETESCSADNIALCIAGLENSFIYIYFYPKEKHIMYLTSLKTDPKNNYKAIEIKQALIKEN